jgi:argininosuccinate lyase
VRKLHGERRDFESMTFEEWRASSELFEPDVVARVRPAASVAAKRTPQSTAPGAVAARLADVRRWLASL